MLVYGHHTVSLNVADFLRRFRTRLDDLPAAPRHDAIVALLVDWGEAESAVADALLPVADDDREELASWRTVSDACADAACASWERDGAAAGAALSRARRALDLLTVASLPADVRSKAAEGFAHYALYPEQYMAAARRFVHEHRPEAVLGLGLRSIGSILAHVVCAMVRRMGVPAFTRSVRPRGHPFDRRLEVTDRLRGVLANAAVSHALVVDEGPGLSGSSFAAAADFLVANGWAAARVVLLPNWLPDTGGFRSAAARQTWERHPKITASFDEVCVRDNRLFGAIAVSDDLSAGAWRARCVPSPDCWPPVQPQHERRKYLGGGGDTIVRFAGLGRHGRSIAARAAALSDSGFAARFISLQHGWLEQAWIEGRMLTCADASNAGVLDRLAEYVAFVGRRFVTTEPESIDQLLTMAVGNAQEAVGDDAARAIDRLAAAARDDPQPRVAVDGRMLPHDWIAAADGLVKTDALDHHADDFWPGCRDIAWDVAGTIAEFELDGDAATCFVTAYARKSGDGAIARRLPFYLAAYTAYRQAYAALAAETLGDTAEGRAFTLLRQRYCRSLAGRLRR
jgi:hypothetical protein